MSIHNFKIGQIAYFNMPNRTIKFYITGFIKDGIYSTEGAPYISGLIVADPFVPTVVHFAILQEQDAAGKASYSVI